MSEMLANNILELEERKVVNRSLSLVPAVLDRCVMPLQDGTGKVLYPAVDLETGKMPNGQSVRSFFERGERSWSEVDNLARHALYRADPEFNL